jgi:hypothetical protein
VPSPFYNTEGLLGLRKLTGESNVHDIGIGFDALGTDLEAYLLGPWEALTEMSPKLEEVSGYETLRVRHEGTAGRLRGLLRVKAGETLSYGTKIAKVASGFAPTGGKAVLLPTVTYTGTSVTASLVEIAPSGNINYGGENLAAGHGLLLDGLTWNLT